MSYGFGVHFYRVLTDLGSFIGGILALSAGILAYCAGLRQAHETARQTAHLKAEGRRALARDSLIAARLLEGVLSAASDGVEQVWKLTEQPKFFRGGPIPGPWPDLIAVPELAVVWRQLEYCETDTITNYMRLAIEANELKRGNRDVHAVRNQLQVLRNYIQFLSEELARQALRCTEVLAHTSE